MPTTVVIVDLLKHFLDLTYEDQPLFAEEVEPPDSSTNTALVARTTKMK